MSVIIFPAFAMTAHQAAKLLADDGSLADNFGQSVSINGDLAIIGAADDDDNGDQSGSAYVFVFDDNGNWIQQAKLTPSDGAERDLFGVSVSVAGDTAIIGARFDDDKGSNSGSAYVFLRDINGNWNQHSKLLADDGSVGDQFGASVSVAGDTAVIGSYLDDDNGSGSGSAYVFLRDVNGNWNQHSKLLADDGAAGDRFGNPVSTDGNTAIIGVFADADHGINSGSAYIFSLNNSNNWVQQAKLIAGDASERDEFGVSVSVAGDTAVIGSYLDDDNGSESGSAYVFVRDVNGNWNQHSKLLADDGAAGDRFGVSVSTTSESIVIGAYNDDDNGNISGSAYLFGRENNGSWSQKDKLIANDGDAGDRFGTSISINNETILIGAASDDDLGSSSGSAYVFNLQSLDADGDGVLDASDNCPNTVNPDQEDSDSDSLGNVCDPDNDNDRIDDIFDLCLGTASGDLVDNSGCSIGQLCPCNDPLGESETWLNHGMYVSCIAKSSRRFVSQGLISRADKGVIVSQAGKSSCGK